MVPYQNKYTPRARWSVDQVVAFVQVDQLLEQLLPGRLLILPCPGLPGLRQSFPDRAVQL